jgi:3'-phosphoadenosine 5'-phosphosulfate sulfotransferase (PAPS reductase)/FAD synthetase
VELWQLKQMQSLPLEAKIVKSQLRIREWYDYWNGQVYVSFSGGKDSTVLLHLVRSMYPNVPAVFADTGLEYPEIREFVRSTENVTIIRPEMTFKSVIEKYGYPVISKRQAQYIREARNTNSEYLYRRRTEGINRDGSIAQYAKISDQWLYLIDAPFKIDDRCCHVMKKRPFTIYERETGRRPYIGTMASEGQTRELNWLQHGCNAFDLKRPTSQPISFWLEEDIWDYLKRYNVPYSKIYDMGWERTGCMWCAFGVHLEDEPNRFQRMAKTHPKLYEYCMKPASEGGLGLAAVLDYIGVDYEFRGEQLRLEWEEDAG